MDALAIPRIALLAALAVAILGASVGIVAFWRRYRRFRGDRLVTCPETQQPATVAIDAMHAASSENQQLRLHDCSRWPERGACGQECLAQIANSPDGCLVKTLVESWYRDHPCILCGQKLDKLSWQEHPPGLIDSERNTVLWTDMRPEQLPGLFESCDAVCWNCHVVETTYRKHPERITERPGKWEKTA